MEACTFQGLIDKHFDGYVSDGYLRQNTPTGPKIMFSEGAQLYIIFLMNFVNFSGALN